MNAMIKKQQAVSSLKLPRKAQVKVHDDATQIVPSSVTSDQKPGSLVVAGASSRHSLTLRFMEPPFGREIRKKLAIVARRSGR